MIPCRPGSSCRFVSNRLGFWLVCWSARLGGRRRGVNLRFARWRCGSIFRVAGGIPRAQAVRVRIPRFWGWAEVSGQRIPCRQELSCRIVSNHLGFWRFVGLRGGDESQCWFRRGDFRVPRMRGCAFPGSEAGRRSQVRGFGAVRDRHAGLRRIVGLLAVCWAAAGRESMLVSPG